MNFILGFEGFVAIPIPDSFTHGVSAIEKLHKPDAALNQPAREDTIAWRNRL